MKTNYWSVLLLLFVSSGISCKKENVIPAFDSNSPYRVGTTVVFNRPSSYSPSGYNDTILFANDTIISGKKYLKAIYKTNGGIAMFTRKDKEGNVYKYWGSSSINPQAFEMIYYKVGKPIGTTWNFKFLVNNGSSVVDTLNNIFRITDDKATFTFKGQTYYDCIKISHEQQLLTAFGIGSLGTFTYIWSDKLGIVHEDNSHGTLIDYVY